MDAPSGDASFKQLYENTVGSLRRYLGRILHNHSEAEDVAHDAYMRVLPTVRENRATNPDALLFVTARRLAFNRLRRRRISVEKETEDLSNQGASAPGVVDEVMARQELSLVELAIRELPPGCRAVLLLRKVEMLSHQEIADRLGIAVSTVEKQHARALRLLKEALPPEAWSRNSKRSGGAGNGGAS
ncbi:RNA polymerase sigma factor [Nibricoccus sp. IMCC34717]|uniref:RNA polymerase sigma factor n=1 Tax=Nibricoccus sp. IMCC34717 TaxID=3034021 RepID=UPI003850AFFF